MIAMSEQYLEVNILMKEEDNALRCTTYDGKTPLMTAVRYNRTEIFQV
jgi:ankyrin repeat protein